jgi:nitrite reductase (NO-forming)
MKSRSRSRVWLAAMAFTLAGAACVANDPDAALSERRGTPAAGGGSEVAAAAGDELVFVATEMAFTPGSIDVEPGTYPAVFRNDGVIVHDIKFDDGTPVVADPGETVRFELAVPEGGLGYICTIPGHADAGMTGLVTTGASGAAPNGHGAGAGGYGDDASEVALVADPAAPSYALFDPVAPARGQGPGITLVEGGAPGGGDLIEVELVVEEKLMTVAEGFSQKVWTFGGTVPGPVIRAWVGDTVRVTLVNPPEAEVPHSIDFHASQVAHDVKMRSIKPGEDLVYEFTADYAGVWMYHCGTPPALHHISNGMYGMVIVEPAGGLEPVEHEFAIVQSEWYLGPQGEVSSLTKAAAAAPAPDYVLLNGVANQYLDNPIQVPTGKSVRMFVLNAGPSVDSSFHVVGTIFYEVIKEGVVLRKGNEGNWGAQAVDLAPAQGAVIEMITAEDGHYPIVTHAFNFVGRGALGLFRSGDGDPTN